MKLVKWLDEHLEETLLVIALVMISCVELIQVAVRNIPFIPSLTWAEEFCRFCWIWSVFLSLPYTIRKASMLRVSVLMDLLPQIVRRIVNVVVDLITFSIMLMMGIHSISVVNGIITSGETSPAMNMPMWIIYIVMLIGFFLGAIRALQQAYIHVRGDAKSEMTSMEQTIAEAAEEAEAGRKAEGSAM